MFGIHGGNPEVVGAKPRRLVRLALLALPIALLSGCGAATRTPAPGDETPATGGTAGSGATTASGATTSGGSSSDEPGSGGSVGSASAGESGSAPVGSGGEPAQRADVDISGEWAMIAFEDPVVASISQSGSELSGVGACEPSGLFGCSGTLHGTLVNQRAVFGFPAGGFATYAADVIVSTDATRMGGYFSVDGAGKLPVAWVRRARGETWLVDQNQELQDALRERAGSYALTLVAGSGEFPTKDYGLLVDLNGNVPVIGGALGAFFGDEMTWNEAEESLVAGPVPATSPALPIKVRLDFEGTELSSVEATLADGTTSVLSAARR